MAVYDCVVISSRDAGDPGEIECAKVTYMSVPVDNSVDDAFVEWLLLCSAAKSLKILN